MFRFALLQSLFLVARASEECDGTETCKFYFDEVCGSDGNTYLNTCTFRKVKCFIDTSLTIVHSGPCCPLKESCPGNDETLPDLGGGYTNDCLFWHDKCTHLEFVSEWTKNNGDMLLSSLQTEEGVRQKTEVSEFMKRFGVEGDLESVTWNQLQVELKEIKLTLSEN